MSLFEKDLAKASRVELLFAGIGDARNLFKTLTDIADQEKEGKIPMTKYHLTINDIKMTVFARDIVLFLILDRLGTLDDADREGAPGGELLVTLYFTYTSIIMPPEASKLMHDFIALATRALMEDDNLLPSWLYVPECCHGELVTILQSWSKEVALQYTTSRLRTSAPGQLRRCLPPHMRADIPGITTPDTKTYPNPFENDARQRKEHPIIMGLLLAESIAFQHETVLFPPRGFSDREVDSLIAAFRKAKSAATLKRLGAYVDKCWLPNVTLIDLEAMKESTLPNGKTGEPRLGITAMGLVDDLFDFKKGPSCKPDIL